MSEFNFVGPSSPSRSAIANGERCINLYPESTVKQSYYSGTPDAHGKSKWVLYGTPGLGIFCVLPEFPVRCVYSADGESLFAVAGSGVYQLYPSAALNPHNNGTQWFKLGAVEDDYLNGNQALPAQMFANGNQLFIISGQNGYVANGLTVFPVTAGVCGGYLDSYYIALQVYSRQFNISAPNDGTSWDALDFGIAEGGPDDIVSLLVSNRELWLFCQQHAEVWDDTGNADFPLQRNPSGFVEQGCIAPWSPQKIANTLLWFGADARGGGIVWRADGYTPVKVSTDAIEWIWSQYKVIYDVITWTYEDAGHGFYVMYFPTADATWVYDIAENEWHERQWLDPVNGTPHAHRGMCHAWCFGEHIVGDRQNGNVYVMAQTTYTDAGNPIRRQRVAPHVSDENEPTFYSELVLDCETGGGPTPPLVDGNGNPRDPVVMMQFSDDGGRTWSNESTVSCGAVGAYKQRVIWRRLGRSRDRVFSISCSEPISVAWINAYLRTKGAASKGRN